ncbi:MAG TPA: hypothetical protein VHO29_04700 [Marmoricola sp.]|nr:hypothetical protein [Marmoricola sp.]
MTVTAITFRQEVGALACPAPGAADLDCKRREGNEGEEAEDRDEEEEGVRERGRKGRARRKVREEMW